MESKSMDNDLCVLKLLGYYNKHTYIIVYRICIRFSELKQILIKWYVRVV